MTSDITQSIIRVLPNFMALVVFLVLVAMKKVRLESIDALSFGRWRVNVFVAVTFVIYLASTEFLSSELGLLQPQKWTHDGCSTLIRLAGVLFFSPVIEEILFRGFILNQFTKRFSFPVSSILVALAFLACHPQGISADVGSIFYLVVGLLNSIIYSYARLKSKTIYLPIFLHMIGNTVAILERFLLS